MQIEIVQFEPSQYEVMANTYMASYNGYIFDAENLKHRDDLLKPNYLLNRWAAIVNNKCVGFGEYSQTPEMGGDDTFQLNIAVHPNYQNHGVGTCLYERVHTEVKKNKPNKLRAVCRSDNYRSCEFLQHRGFAVEMSIKELSLDLGQPSTIVSQTNLKSTEGIIIETMLNLKIDSNRDRKMYSLVTAVRRDVPGPQESNDVPFDQFEAAFILAPSRLQEATFIACDSETGEYVGISDLFSDGKNGLLAGVTGVRREYRRSGIATALKQCGLLFASDHGYTGITTFYTAENAAIAAVNKHFGFIEKFTWLHYEQQVSNT